MSATAAEPSVRDAYGPFAQVLEGPPADITKKPRGPVDLNKQTADGTLFVAERLCQMGQSSSKIAIGTLCKQSDKDFHAKVEALKGMAAQGLAIRYAASMGMSSPTFTKNADTVACNENMVPIHIARDRGLDTNPAGFIAIFPVAGMQRGGV